jgi:hypothetical protein
LLTSRISSNAGVPTTGDLPWYPWWIPIFGVENEANMGVFRWSDLVPQAGGLTGTKSSGSAGTKARGPAGTPL